MMDPEDPAEPGAAARPAVVPPRGLAGLLDEYDPNATFDTSEFPPGHVFLNVYDFGDSETFRQINLVSTVNNNLLLGGIFHGGIEIYGNEWCYGYTDEEGRSGVQRMSPRSHSQHSYRTTVPLGKTELCEPEVQAVLERLCTSADWLGAEYDLISHNCLTFCNAVCEELGVEHMPGWVDRAQRVADGACHTASLARAVSIEVEQTVRGALPEAPVDTEDAQRIVSEAVETLRRESVKAMEVVSAQTQELAEATQVQAQVLGEAVQDTAQALGARAQELLGDDLSTQAGELAGRTQERAQSLGSSLWQWGQDLQRAASRALQEDNTQGHSTDAWDMALLGGLVGGASESSRRQDLARRREARKKKRQSLQREDWSNSALLQRAPVPERLAPAPTTGAVPDPAAEEALQSPVPVSTAAAAVEKAEAPAAPAAAAAAAPARGPPAEEVDMVADEQE